MRTLTDKPLANWNSFRSRHFSSARCFIMLDVFQTLTRSKNHEKHPIVTDNFLLQRKNEKPWRFNHIPPPFGAWQCAHPTTTRTLACLPTWTWEDEATTTRPFFWLWRWHGAFGGSLFPTVLNIAVSHKQLLLSSLILFFIVALLRYVLMDYLLSFWNWSTKAPSSHKLIT
jgi:hypothetical protein